MTVPLRFAFPLACALWAVLLPQYAAAQTSRPSRLAIDTTAAADSAVDANGNYGYGTAVDAFVSVSLGRFEAIAWPVVQRLQSGQWNKDVWIAALRYEHRGAVGIRVDAGLIPSPIGLANLTVRRPHLNPTIASPSSLFTQLPPWVSEAPTRNPTNGVTPPPTSALANRGGFVRDRIRLRRSGDVSMRPARMSQWAPDTVTWPPSG